MKLLVVYLSSLSLLFISTHAQSRPDILAVWKLRYPESRSSERECQLCHQMAEVGGDGWNSYGIAIRDVVGQVQDVNDAIAAVESFNADRDEGGLSNLEEITMHLDPGWRYGNVNPIFFENETILENQPAPFDDVDGRIANESSLELCFPVNTENTTALICL